MCMYNELMKLAKLKVEKKNGKSVERSDQLILMCREHNDSFLSFSRGNEQVMVRWESVWVVDR